MKVKKEILDLIENCPDNENIEKYLYEDKGGFLLSSLLGFIDAEYCEGIENIIDDFTSNQKLKREGVSDKYVDFYNIYKNEIEEFLLSSDTDIFEIFKFIPRGWLIYGFPEEAEKLLDAGSELWARVFLERIYFDLYKDDPKFNVELLRHMI